MAGSLPGFQGLHPTDDGAPSIFIQMIRSKLTSNLGALPLSDDEFDSMR